MFISTPVFTRLLAPYEYGEVILYYSWANILSIFATLSLSGSMFNVAMLDFEKDLDAFMSSMIGLSTVSIVVSFCLVMGATMQLGDFTSLGPTLLSFMFIAFLFNSTLMLWQARERFFYRYRLLTAVSIPSSVVGIAMAVALVAFFPAHRVESRVMAAALPSILAGLVLYAVLMRRGGTFFRKDHWRYALIYVVPMLPHYISQQLILQFDRFAIERISGKAEVGLYGLAYAVATGVTLFWSALQASIVPWLLRKMNERKSEDIRSKVADVMSTVGFLCVLLGLAAPEVIRLLAPAAYQGAAEVVPILLLASYFQFVLSIYLTAQSHAKRIWSIAGSSMITAVLNVVLNIVCIRAYGYEAAAYIVVASNLVQLIYHRAVVKRLDGIRLIDGKDLLVVSVGTVAMTGVTELVRLAPWPRYAIAAIVAMAFSVFLFRVARTWKTQRDAA